MNDEEKKVKIEDPKEYKDTTVTDCMNSLYAD
jgi:hypothetical protein